MDKLRSSYYLKLKYVIIEISSLKAFFFFFGPKNKNELHGTDEINLTRGLAFVSALGRKTHHHQGGPARFVFSLLPEIPKFPTSVSARHARPCVTKHTHSRACAPKPVRSATRRALLAANPSLPLFLRAARFAFSSLRFCLTEKKKKRETNTKIDRERERERENR
jgi:hypothetical protein